MCTYRLYVWRAACTVAAMSMTRHHSCLVAPAPLIRHPFLRRVLLGDTVWDIDKPLHSPGASVIFFDRNPQPFSVVLDFLRTGKVWVACRRLAAACRVCAPSLAARRCLSTRNARVCLHAVRPRLTQMRAHAARIGAHACRVHR